MTTRTTGVLIAAAVTVAAIVGTAFLVARGASDTGPAEPAPAPTGGKADQSDPDYWTDERMREAKPVMPEEDH